MLGVCGRLDWGQEGCWPALWGWGQEQCHSLGAEGKGTMSAGMFFQAHAPNLRDYFGEHGEKGG